MELFCARQRRKFSRGIKRAPGVPSGAKLRLAVPWLLLGNMFLHFADCGLVVEIQPLNC